MRATTKPLVGLFGNAPHFTRALDRDLAHMVHSEFRVASARSGHEPWFDLDEAANVFGGRDVHDWLDDLLVDRRALDGSPTGLRRAFMAFLMDFAPPPNPAVLGRTTFDPLEVEGADVFARTCVSCHAARLVADDATTEVPRAGWADHVFGNEGRTPGAIVWARSGYEKTGIEPYVHERGARPTSLRRLARKRPYFTNGTARTLGAVLEAARIAGDGTFRHAVGPGESGGARPLPESERRALLAFLRLL